jgi:hypothetical protein
MNKNEGDKKKNNVKKNVKANIKEVSLFID